MPFVDILLNAVHERQVGRVFALEIGAGDGEGPNSLLSYYRDDRWSGLLIEPMPDAFARLDRLHAESDRVAVLNLGISDIGANALIHFLAPAAAERLGPAHRGRASIMRDRIVTAGVDPGEIQSVEVPFLRLDLVLNELGISSVQVLKVNAGGHEAQVLASLDISAFGLLLVLVATNPGTPADSDCIDLLVRAGLVPYRVADWLVGLAPDQLSLPLDDLLALFGRRIGQVDTDPQQNEDPSS
jgi:FkbM family methyltransferase